MYRNKNAIGNKRKLNTATQMKLSAGGRKMKNDKLVLGGHEFESRFILGSGKYNVELIKAAVEQAGAEIITLAVRRANSGGAENILDFIPQNVNL